jgi:hypothetical protein
MIIRTMQTLQMERVKREKELDMLRSSEPKLVREIAGLKEAMGRMQLEMKVGRRVRFANSVFLNAVATGIRQCGCGHSQIREDSKRAAGAAQVLHQAPRCHTTAGMPRSNVSLFTCAHLISRQYRCRGCLLNTNL